MRVAIYARYSSENQSQTSIEDQIRVCRRYIHDHALTVEDQHVYTDQAVSGSLAIRPGLQALERAAENNEFLAVVVDDLSRLSRNNHQMLTLVLRLAYLQVKIISVSDGLVSDEENAKLGIHLRGLINEMYLDDLSKKTKRGLEGQKLRGFSAGETVYGYRTKPVGELKFNKRGHARYDGKVHVIDADEAEVVRRVFNEFTTGKSLHKIAAVLNTDKIPTKQGKSGGWNTSSLSRILKNEKYTGQWIWRKQKRVRDPLTGKAKQIPRPKEEQMTFFREDLVLIDNALWEKAQQRWKDLAGTWPVAKEKKAYYQQKSYVHTSPTHLLSGLMRCDLCEGAVVLLSGKGSGYYGCYNAKRKTCSNTLLVSRKDAEEKILTDLKERILTPDNLSIVYKKVDKEVHRNLHQVPASLEKIKRTREKVQTEIRHYLDFIKSGNMSKAVADALKEAEEKDDKLNHDINSLEFQRKRAFIPPSKEWIRSRLDRFQETLKKDTVSSALALKEVLGTIRLRPVDGESQNSEGEHYTAHLQIQTLALLDERHTGSNWSQIRTRLKPIRTAGELAVSIDLSRARPLYQRVAAEATELRSSGFSYKRVGQRLGHSHNLVRRACRFQADQTSSKK